MQGPVPFQDVKFFIGTTAQKAVEKAVELYGREKIINLPPVPTEEGERSLGVRCYPLSFFLSLSGSLRSLFSILCWFSNRHGPNPRTRAHKSPTHANRHRTSELARLISSSVYFQWYPYHDVTGRV